MPALLNIAANLILGAAVVLAVRRAPAVTREVTSWAFLALLAFEALVFTPGATFLFRFYTQWSMLYWFDPQIHPNFERWVVPLSAAVVVLNFLAAALGFLAARCSLVTGRVTVATIPFVLSLAAFLVIGALYGDRVMFVGDYDEFWQGQAVMLFRRGAGWVGAGLYAAAAAFVIWLHVRFKDRDPALL